ncbi:hypothetical protein LNTAR_13012 [Lentisphaera araneosa HTCC2155]|uniref:SMI1/KNR4 family protein n=2 Tax=Lentisphaera TaxID=256846 RepID=A6DRK1_9BACT|nr:hypothetical protein LNTAR_13012 [Lentisphaera araneosa HTCC2155]
MYLPDPLKKLFDWIEHNKLYTDQANGRTGFLFPEDKLNESWTDEEREGGTLVYFYPEGNVNLKYWFGHEKPDVMNRLCVFAKTGGEGSQAALWLDDDGKQKIIHMGSGSGSVLCCVLAEDPIDFLRLLAIGYDEICWNSEFSYPPNSDPDECHIKPNIEFQNWVQKEFNTTIPQTALEIVKHPDEMGDEKTKDEFNQWVNKIV